MVPPAALIELFEAVRTHAVATFAYRTEERRVAPVGLWFRFGHWYLVAWDLGRAAVRTFRVDRIEGEVCAGRGRGRRGPAGRRREGGSARRAVGRRGRGPGRDAGPGGRTRGTPGGRRGRAGQSGRAGSPTDRSSSCSGCRRSPPSAPGCSACSTTPPSSSRPPSGTSWWPGSVRSTAPLRPWRMPGAGAGCRRGGEAPAEAAERPRARDEPPPPPPVGPGRLAGPGRRGPHRRGGEPIRHEREGARGRARAGRLLRYAALHPGHAHGDRGLGALRPRLPAGRVRPPPPPHPGRGVRRRRLGPVAPRRARLGGRRPAPRPGQARRGTRVPRGGRARRRCPGPPGDRAGGGRDRPSARDRLPLGLAGRAHDARRWSRCRSSRSTAIGISTPTATGPGTCGASGWTASARRAPLERTTGAGRRRGPGRWRRCSCPGPGADRGPPAARSGRAVGARVGARAGGGARRRRHGDRRGARRVRHGLVRTAAAAARAGRPASSARPS